MDNHSYLTRHIDLHALLDYKNHIVLLLPALFIFSSLINLLVVNLSFYLASTAGSEISDRLFKKLIHTERGIVSRYSIGELTQRIVNESYYVSINIIQQALLFIPALVKSILLLAALKISISLGNNAIIAVCIGYYALIFYISKSRLSSIGNKLKQLQYKRAEVVHDAISAIEEIQLYKKSTFFENSFGTNNKSYFSALYKNNLYAQTPKHLLETLGILMLSTYLFYLAQSSPRNFTEALPDIIALIFIAYKILPSAQSLYVGISKIYSHKDILNSLISLDSTLEQKLPPTPTKPHPSTTLALNNITFDSVAFRYPESNNWVFKDLNLSLNLNKRTALIGPSGIGKSTLLNLILGILNPISGQISLDNKNLDVLLESFRAQTSYIKQTSTIIGSTIIENVAFGEPLDKINLDYIAELLDLVKFPIKGLLFPDYLFHPLGSQGLHLSGGERKRLILARALYRKPRYMIIDEAMSELDSEIQIQILNNLLASVQIKGLLIVSHSRTPISFCDEVISLYDKDIELKKCI